MQCVTAREDEEKDCSNNSFINLGRGVIFFAPLTTSRVISRDLNLKFEF
jgi:hypothetical protein